MGCESELLLLFGLLLFWAVGAALRRLRERELYLESIQAASEAISEEFSLDDEPREGISSYGAGEFQEALEKDFSELALISCDCGKRIPHGDGLHICKCGRKYARRGYSGSLFREKKKQLS